MTLLYMKAREGFDQDHKKSPAKNTAPTAKDVKQKKSGKLFRKNNQKK
ncbi:hypothetical protein [Salimicrobium halophilum]|uniref:Uncharacterized protein n=1 Tax=Salimicrobium halophilum TaxID=86666 RepID=A0A1G8TYB1_9BACI|nr:hypothetical protein [Salimicrobium halophilum]SDJ46489.1 hypothetical protein SAMN04490247_2039 [Salimicrobium halophilum]